LIGKKILVSNRHALGGYLAQFMLLKDLGLDPDKDLIYQFGDTQEKILEKVASGRSEVGFIREDVLQAMNRARGEISGVRVIASTNFHPTHCLVKYPRTDLVLVEKVTTALLKLNPDNPAHRFILERLRISRFDSASIEDYLPFKYLLIRQGLYSGSLGPSSKLKEEKIAG
jgi:ABC-type phosphate/phosphonate transport system substrate-binding protein